MTDDILDDLFHGCAFAALLEEANACQDWPAPKAVKRRAYQLYEEALAERNHAKAALSAAGDPGDRP